MTAAMTMHTFWMFYNGGKALAARLDAHWDQGGHWRSSCVECDCIARLHEAAWEWAKGRTPSGA